MKARQPRVLYFTKGPKPTDKELAHAQALSANVGFRFAAGAKDGVGFEADAVATSGVNVPNMYRERGVPYVKTNAELRRIVAEKAGVEEFDPDSVEIPAENDGEGDDTIDAGNGEQQPPAANSWGNGGAQ